MALTESVISLVYSIAIGLSTAATAVVARRIGEKNPDGASHAGAQSLIIALLATAGDQYRWVYMFAGNILSLMGADEQVVREGTDIHQDHVWKQPVRSCYCFSSTGFSAEQEMRPWP